MHRLRISRPYGKLLFAGFVIAALSTAPVQVSGDFGVDSSSALAKNGNGGGKGGGKGGDNGGGKGGGNRGGSADAGSGPGNSSSAPGHNKSDIASSKGGLGSLSASNASANARAHAAPSSQVGKLDAYEKALASGDLAGAAAALGSAANKEITPDTVAQVNRNMGIESTPEAEAEVAALAEAARTADPLEGESEGEGENVAGGDASDDSTEVEDGEIASAAEDLIDGAGTTTQ